MARNGKWDTMKRLGLNMVTCTLASCDKAPHDLQSKDLADHQRTLDGKCAMRQSYAEAARAARARREQRKAAGGGLKHSGGRWR